MTAGRQEDNNGTEWKFAVNSTNPPTVIDGMQVLDGGYPYVPYSGDDYQGFWYPANGTSDGNSDSPGQPLDSSASITSYDVVDSFLDYLMYQPPGNSYPVPLKDSNWYWAFQATKDDNGNWSTSNESAEWEFVSDFPAFPIWNFVAPIGSLIYVAPSS